MGDPAGKIKQDGRFSQIQRIINKSICMKIIPHMVKRHDDHDQASQDSRWTGFGLV